MGIFSRMFLGGKSKGSVGIVKPLVLPKKSKNIHVTVRDLSAWDLRSSQLPEDDYNIWVKIKVAEGANYTLVYSDSHREPMFRDRHYPRVSLSLRLDRDPTKIDRKAFDEMLTYVSHVNQGREVDGRPAMVEYHGITALVHEDKIPFTQKFIANMVDKYASRFEGASIPVAYFRVPESALEFPGFSRDKLERDKPLV